MKKRTLKGCLNTARANGPGIRCAIQILQSDCPWIVISGETIGGSLGYDPALGHGYRGGGSVFLGIFENATPWRRSGVLLFQDDIFEINQPGCPGEPPYELLLKEGE